MHAISYPFQTFAAKVGFQDAIFEISPAFVSLCLAHMCSCYSKMLFLGEIKEKRVPYPEGKIKVSTFGPYLFMFMKCFWLGIVQNMYMYYLFSWKGIIHYRVSVLKALVNFTLDAHQC